MDTATSDEQPARDLQIFPVPEVMARERKGDRVNDGADGERSTTHLGKRCGRENSHRTDYDQRTGIPKQMRGIKLHDGSRSICRRRGLTLAQERSQSFQIGRTDHSSPCCFAKIVV
jgi:hypothetical protein